jgi:hypothetical protein
MAAPNEFDESTGVMQDDLVQSLVDRTRGDSGAGADYEIEVVKPSPVPPPVPVTGQSRQDKTLVVEPLPPPVVDQARLDDREQITRPVRSIGNGRAALASLAALVIAVLNVGFPYHRVPGSAPPPPPIDQPAPAFAAPALSVVDNVTSDAPPTAAAAPQRSDVPDARTSAKPRSRHHHRHKHTL